MGKNTQKTYKVWPVLSRLVKEVVKEYPVQIPRVIIYTIFAVINPFFVVFIPKIAIGILEKNGPDVAKELIVTMAVYFVAAAIVAIFVSKTKFRLESTNMRSRIIYLCKMGNKLMKMDYNYVEDAKFWEDNDRALKCADNNAEGYEGLLNHLYKLPSNVIIILVMMALLITLSPWILLALIAHTIVTTWVSRLDHNYRYEHKADEAKLYRKMSYYEKTSQDFSYGKDVRIYDLRERIIGNYKTETESFLALRKQFENHKYFISLASILTLLVSNVLIYGILIYKAYNGMPISSFSMYLALVVELMSRFTSFGEELAFLKNNGQYVGDAFALMDEDLETDKKEKIQIPEGDTLEIVFEHVDFKYPGSDKYIYKDLNFTIHKGERLAIVGINGAGKSTLVKLMTGMFAPTAGHIYINGHDITDFNKRDLYDLYSAVFQDVNIMAFPIRANVAGSKKDVDDARVMESLDKVGLGDKVRSFDKGLDQMMLKIIDEEGTDFSGGERQKLSIARGLYKDAPMVIMDEPTAALDALAEQSIYESFSSMVEGKTAVYISHRLASTKFCDKIALFDNNGLLEYGTHDELMEKEGEYYKMFVIQGKYYQEQGAAV